MNDPKKIKKYVYYRHITTGKMDEMNWWEWEDIQKDRSRSKNFELIRVVDLDALTGGATPAPRQETSSSAPIEEDSLQCPLCGQVCKTEAALKKHKTQKHG